MYGILFAMESPLQGFRDRLDTIDGQLVQLLAERFEVTAQVGAVKRDSGLPPQDPAREAAQMERIAGMAEAVGLNPEFAQRFLRVVIDEVVENHKAMH